MITFDLARKQGVSNLTCYFLRMWRNGRRARFRTLCRKAWRFDSSHPHQVFTPFSPDIDNQASQYQTVINRHEDSARRTSFFCWENCLKGEDRGSNHPAPGVPPGVLHQGPGTLEAALRSAPGVHAFASDQDRPNTAPTQSPSGRMG